MPVVRISDATWDRLKRYARPLEDTPDDVIRTALDALDKTLGKTPPKPIRAAPKPRGKKTPQREFRNPLMRVLLDLGGAAFSKDIRDRMEPEVRSMLGAADLAPVSSGDPRWWNAVCWERNDLKKEGLMRSDSDRGIWELSEDGLREARRLSE
ncbi:winged helix-turn-helix domain-containing protein [Pelagibacterium sp. 26DY04]|nr:MULTISPECIES: winged helix-turn-helix domain-containing protein [Devosiaceae]WMT85533.1 winged helix-turn-helix domain-containing protein [Pelagibacterium sp. 26DY04]|tara:strand:+ start:1015 stop:1473 length:459 start_codon:yes stop_codon:yes gene_type:complete